MLVRCRVRFRGNPMLGLDVARAIAFERGGSSTHLHWIRCSRLRLLGIGWHLRCLASPDFQRCLRRLLSQTYNNSTNEVDLGMSLRSSMAGNIGTPEGPDPVVPCMRQERHLSLSTAQEHAASLGGLCLSPVYKKSRIPLLWQCGAGHQWQAAFTAVRHGGTWCPICAQERRRKGLQFAQAIAASRGGYCRSEVYKNMHAPVSWECELGHAWQAPLQNVLYRGSWCQKCAMRSRRLGIERAREIARQRKGECLSASYVNNATPLQWQCHMGHVWDATLNAVKDSGSWCPVCLTGKCEQAIRSLSCP